MATQETPHASVETTMIATPLLGAGIGYALKRTLLGSVVGGALGIVAIPVIVLGRMAWGFAGGPKREP